MQGEDQQFFQQLDGEQRRQRRKVYASDTGDKAEGAGEGVGEAVKHSDAWFVAVVGEPGEEHLSDDQQGENIGNELDDLDNNEHG